MAGVFFCDRGLGSALEFITRLLSNRIVALGSFVVSVVTVGVSAAFVSCSCNSEDFGDSTCPVPPGDDWPLVVLLVAACVNALVSCVFWALGGWGGSSCRQDIGVGPL